MSILNTDTPEIGPRLKPHGRAKVYVSYAHRDAKHLKKLEVELTVLLHQGLIEAVWHDQHLDPGDKWHDQINAKLEDADVIILLISAASLASNYITQKEIPHALQKYERQSAILIPIILERCSWSRTELGKFFVLPTGGKPVVEWKPQSKAWHNVGGELRRVFELFNQRVVTVGEAELDNEQPPVTVEPSSEDSSATNSEVRVGPRGSNLTDGRAMQDQASATDSMGRSEMIVALADFISSKDSVPPLSVTIEAPWGEGKSSAMVQLRRYLAVHKLSQTIWFNPWRYTEPEALWSGFLAEFTEQIQKGKSLFAKFLIQHRYLQATYGRWVLLRCFGAIMAVPILFYLVRWWLLSQLPSLADGWSSWLGQIAAIVAAWGSSVFVAAKLWFAFHKPVRTLGAELKAYFSQPDYAAKRGSSERLHREFRAWLVACNRPGERIFVFIDDLDRCAGSRAAELLDWLQLMMSNIGDGSNDPFPLVVVAGLDREKVAAAVAMRQSEMMPILAPGDTAREKAEAAIIWGYGYLEKFVDLPVRLPPGSAHVLESFLADLAPEAVESEKRLMEVQRKNAEAARTLRLGNLAKTFDKTIPTPASDNEKPEAGDGVEAPLLSHEGEDWRVPGLLRSAAVWLNHSPRRIKHFLNLLRLRWAVRRRLGEDRMTLELTARLVLVETARPTLFRAIADHSSVRAALFEQQSEESPGIFRRDGRWMEVLGSQVFDADKDWLSKHGEAVLVDDWDDILHDHPESSPSERDEFALTRDALDALIDGTLYR
ncbi:MAG: TIR domain-containing protein [Verrucomicrobiaceae bacterium]|nr:TIR domain-containing protein [Verrucomicrobiaceae bacterium]